MASAALDRLLHRATVLNIRGDSYRMKGRHRAGERVEVIQASTEQQPETQGQPKRSRCKPEPAAEEVSA